MVTVVSGIFRSGTSMMMQMLYAGGLPCVYDNKSDSDNPKGYFESFSVAKYYNENPDMIREAEGKAIKIILPARIPRTAQLPFGHDYRVILMQRPASEVLISHQTMLMNREGKNSDGTPLPIIVEENEIYVRTADQASLELGALVMAVPYHDVLNEPEFVARAIVDFLQLPLDTTAMIGQIDSRLYRNRVGSCPR